VSDARFFAVPEKRHRVRAFGLALSFGILFAAAYVGASAISGYIPWRIDVALPFDRHVPFWPAASLAYLSVTPLLCMAPFVRREPAQLRVLFYAMTLATLVGFAAFVVLPVDAAALDSSAESDLLLFRVADTLNLERNDFPSLHVALTTLCALSYGAGGPFVRRGWILLWCSVVVLSTMLIHEHFIADVLAGGLLAWGCWRLALSRAASSRWVDALEVELLCMHGFLCFSRRHRRYLVISLALIWGSLPRYRANRLLRTGFAFLQTVDDLLDGDRPSDVEPLVQIDQLVVSLESGAFADGDLSRLAQAFRADLLERGGAGALGSAIALMRTMQFDRRRVLYRQLLEADALRAQLGETFRHSVDLMLLAARSPVRALEVPELIEAFSWCSTIRDLDEDLARGLVNIPLDVMRESGMDPWLDPACDIRAAPAVAAWLNSEARRAERMLDGADSQLARLADAKGRRILVMFARSIRRYLRLFPEATGRPALQSSAISG
jgi:membrane-associated phospholipid phosphatase